MKKNRIFLFASIVLVILGAIIKLMVGKDFALPLLILGSIGVILSILFIIKSYLTKGHNKDH